MAPRPNELTNLALDAVKALLKEIAVGAKASPGSSSATAPNGTYASFSARALRDLLEIPEIAKLVEPAMEAEDPNKGS
jgi:hypothetical protein